MGLLTRKDCWKFDQSWDFKRRNWCRREMGHRPRTRGQQALRSMLPVSQGVGMGIEESEQSSEVGVVWAGAARGLQGEAKGA